MPKKTGAKTRKELVGYKVCKVCKDLVALDQLRVHMDQVHNPSAEQKLQKKSPAENELAAVREGPENVPSVVLRASSSALRKLIEKANSAMQIEAEPELKPLQSGGKYPAVACPICHVIFNTANLGLHVVNQHGARALNRKARKLDSNVAVAVRRKLAGDVKATDEKRIVNCQYCGVKVGRGKLNRHISRVHSEVKATPVVVEKLGEMSPSERRKRLRKMFGPDDDDKGSDVFDRTRVVSGGGFGLGKNRKH